MASSTQPRQRGSRWRRTAIVAGLLVVVTILIGALLWPAFSGGPLTLRDQLSQSSEIGPREDTETLCAEADCIEGWRTDAGVFLRFRTNDAAEYWHYVIGGDSIRYDNVLLDLNGLELTQDDRRYVIDVLFSRRDWHM